MPSPPALAAENARLRLRLERERAIRLEAERLAEHGTRQLYERQQQVELLHVVAEAANAAASVEDCLQIALDHWCRFSHWPVGHVYLVSEDPPRRLVSTGLWHLEPPEKFELFRSVTEATPLESGAGLPGTVLETGRASWVADVMQSPNFPRAKGNPGLNVHGAFAFPIRIGQETVAVAEFFSTQPEESNEAWLHLATQVGTLLGRVFERIRAKRELERVHQELVAASRRAGMAEVATSVLHNVGNVLTSLTVAAATVSDRLIQSRLPLLQKSVDLIKEHAADLPEFLAADPKGKALPDFLARLATHLTEENNDLRQRMEGLTQHVEHIRQIVAAQQSHGRSFGIIETLDPRAMVEDAVRLDAESLTRHGVSVERDFAAKTPVTADRHRVLQILVNLLRNAKQAILEAAPAQRRISIRTLSRSPGRLAIAVADNGIGISRENLPRIFRHGFTTKKEGHGFGLHNSVLFAREMKGDLTVQSDGPGLGSIFTLELPTANS